jgi:large subunit ribosomal protein L15
MNASLLTPPPGATHRKKIVGRGPSSGHGKTSTRGHKGQKARSKVPLWFEGGQMPITRRVPKRGFAAPFKQKNEIVNVKDLNIFQKNNIISPELLIKTGLVKKGKIKILGKGELNLALKVKAHQFSKEAERKIKEAGGKVEII